MKQYQVSVILSFRDHEDIIGIAVARLASHARERGLRFELIAVDDDSGDNSQAVLALIRSEYPELEVVHAPGRGRGHEWGARTARGQVLWFVEPETAVGPLSGAVSAIERVLRGERDVVAVDQRFVIAHRARCIDVVRGVRGVGHRFHQRLLRRARGRGLGVQSPAGPRRRWAAPLVAALSLTRSP